MKTITPKLLRSTKPQNKDQSHAKEDLFQNQSNKKGEEIGETSS
jgi:hypothetical protein